MAETGSRKYLSSPLLIALLCFSPLLLFPPASSSSLWFLGRCYCEDSAAPICFQHMGPTLLLPKSLYLLFRAGGVIVWKVRQKVADWFHQSVKSSYSDDGINRSIFLSIIHPCIHIPISSTAKLCFHTRLCKNIKIQKFQDQGKYRKHRRLRPRGDENTNLHIRGPTTTADP